MNIVVDVIAMGIAGYCGLPLSDSTLNPNAIGHSAYVTSPRRYRNVKVVVEHTLSVCHNELSFGPCQTRIDIVL